MDSCFCCLASQGRFKLIQITGFIVAFFGALLVITAGSAGVLSVDNPGAQLLPVVSIHVGPIYRHIET